MNVHTEKVNKHSLASALKIQQKLVQPQKPRRWRGKDIFPDREFWVCSILAKRRSGKTSLILKMLEAFASKDMIIYFFCPNFWKGPIYEAMRKLLDSRGIPYHHYGGIIEDGVNMVENLHKNIVEWFKSYKMQMDAWIEENKTEKVDLSSPIRLGPDEKKVKSPKPVMPPKTMIIFDDNGMETRNLAIDKLVKSSFQLDTKIILSSQSIVDLPPNVHNQLDFVCLFKNFNEDSLYKQWERLPLKIEFDTFQRLYNQITNEKRKDGLSNFLFIDLENQTFRRNLNEKIISLKKSS